MRQVVPHSSPASLAGPALMPDGRIADVLITLRDGSIASVERATAAGVAAAELRTAGVIAPGFLDLQLNGGWGCDFTIDPAAIAQVAERLPQTGVTGFLPTCITSPLESYAGWLETAQAVSAAVNEGGDAAQVLGVHLEGVYFSPQKAGAHNPALLRAIDVDEILTLYAISPLVKVVTLAPELEGAHEAIRALKARGILVSAGHSNATFAQAQAALAAGIGWGTHLFNAMHDLRHREPGLAAALLLSSLPVGIIVDGVHLHPAIVQMVYRLKGAAGITLVTDAMAAMGMPPGVYNLGGYEVQVDGHSARLPSGTLAGSILTMDGAVRHLIAQSGCSLAEALTMASRTPADLLGLPAKGRITPGADADLVLLDADLRVETTFIAGQVAWSRPA
ncbi:MAG: N-acetylglucosamine-6-phosphate deacetylase [Caldilineaceae bacterium]